MKQRALYFIICFFLMSFTSFSQNQQKKILSSKKSSSEKSISRLRLQETHKIDEKSKTEEKVFININEKKQNLHLMISGELSQGEMTIEIYDPKGIKRGNFTVGSPDKTHKVFVKGNFAKTIHDPQQGKWKIKTIPKKAKGTVKMQSILE